jgi:UV excision repair protein RAD23
MSISVTIKPLKGDTFKVDIEEAAKVIDLKRKIAEAKPAEFKVEEQKLILQGKIMADDSSLTEYGVKTDTTIIIMAAKAAPKAKAEPKAAPAPSPTSASATTPTPAPATEPAPTPAAAPLPAIITDLKSNAKWPQLAQVVARDPRVLNRMLGALGPWPDLRDAIVQHIQGFVTMCRDEAGVVGGPMPIATAVPPGGAGGPGPGDLQQILAMAQQNPQMMQQLIQELPPELQQLAQQDPQRLLQVLQQMAAGGLGGGGAGGGSLPVPAELSADETAAVERLAALGFPKEMCTQAYFACGKNEELAANFLFDGGGDEPMTEG